MGYALRKAVLRSSATCSAPSPARVLQGVLASGDRDASMTTNRRVYHVVPNTSGDKWLLSQENSDSNSEDFRTKAEAIEAAKQRARKQEPSQVKVHKSDGNMEYESTYGARKA
jgi:hypothetical protein